ncbi:MAG TPA: hypothetical protein VE954_28815 [Oligoflexus sp.]|uniref:hypothetical protein n=1 Tax=Oligoflexus sp. TaxID=1971216 RepID=UPI002D6035D8|nr:hypothetical protein [Oligoflexus sp.]HYX37123.1 hypothetical protein [Oligoflexus sp.]
MHENDNESVQPTKSKFEAELSIALIDGFKDSAEPLLDFVSNLEGVAKELPVLGLAVSIYRAGKAFSGQRFQKKLRTFIQEVESKDIAEYEKEKFLKRFKNSQEQEEIISEVIETIDRLRDAGKTKVYANLFLSFVYGNITWERLVLLAECLENLNSVCIKNLIKFSYTGTYIRGDGEPEIYDDFYVSSGLARLVVDGHFDLNELGLQLLRCGLLNSQAHRDILKLLTDLDARFQEYEDTDTSCELSDDEMQSIKEQITLLLLRIPFEERSPYEFGYSASDTTGRLLSDAFEAARKVSSS